MNYKMIASDLDGTLLYDVFSVSNENMEAIKKFDDMGGYVVPTSGRCFFEILPEIRECKSIRYCISSNGAVITDLVTGEREEVGIVSELLRTVVDTVSEYETHIALHYNGTGYIDAETDNEEKAEYYNVNKYYYIHYHKWCEKIENLRSFCKSGIDAEMLSVFFRKQSELDECVKRLKDIGGLIVTSSADFNIEIIAEGATKGDGVRRLAKRLGIDISEVIGVGDSRNDISLLEAVGLPLAVENASEELKQKAKKVICHHTQNVIPYIVENFVL